MSYGTLTVNNRDRVDVYATEVIRLSETDWIREFYGYWQPSTDQARIIVDRLDYELICNVTVPA